MRTVATAIVAPQPPIHVGGAQSATSWLASLKINMFYTVCSNSDNFPASCTAHGGCAVCLDHGAEAQAVPCRRCT